MHNVIEIINILTFRANEDNRGKNVSDNENGNDNDNDKDKVFHL